jgi:hypothetical protein
MNRATIVCHVLTTAALLCYFTECSQDFILVVHSGEPYQHVKQVECKAYHSCRSDTCIRL